MSTESQEQLTRPQRQTDYYLGLDEWLKTPEFQQFVENEFQSSPLREGEEKESPIARREFLKLMGASLAMLS
ncbi:MAG: TAT-variant-translocated molybdopterin oxidoreductase, partial [Bdellovibrionaceae bacterium]|nr:TAT-variant-translocated molybdopterin oxidoreductase [Pseudobdellovibrionaceae bacterium]